MVSDSNGSHRKSDSDMTLHEIRCRIQRQRMGVSESILSDENPKTHMTSEEAVKFIQQNFTFKECMRYVPDKDGGDMLPDVCHCGQRQSHHLGKNHVDEDSEKWTENDFQTFSGSNAFGSIIFRDEHSGARKPSKFLRVGCRLQVPNFSDILDSGKSAKQMLDLIDPEVWATVDNTIHFLKNDWKLYQPIPNLAVAIIGGAKQFKLDSKRVETFSRGLVKVAISTHAWVLTGGCNFGIMKTVGDCIRDGQTLDGDDDEEDLNTARIRCIGVCLWGYIKDRENLVIRSKIGVSNRRPQTAYGQRPRVGTSGVPIATGPQNPEERIPSSNLQRAYNEPVRMYTSIKSAKSEGYLNPDHSHFLFVDNGYRNHKCIHDSLFMLCLLHRLNQEEVFIDDPLPEGVKLSDLSVPSVVIVVEGGLTCIDSVYFAIHIGIPVVICSHTGRAADVFTAAVEIMLEIQGSMSNPELDVPIPTVGDYHFIAVQKKIHKAFFKEQEFDIVKDQTQILTQRVFEASSQTKLITVFDLTAREDFDSAILSALLKVDKSDEKSQKETAMEQLTLALTWDRADIAEEKIFPSYPEQLPECQKNLKLVMQNALLKEKLSFVTLLINRGTFSLKEFLNIDTLHQLYKEKLDGKDRDKYLSRLFGQFKRRNYRALRDAKSKSDSTAEMVVYWHFLADLVPFFEVPDGVVVNPYRELFLWSVLLNRVEMAKYFWQKVDHPIFAALIAALLSKALADKAEIQDSEVLECYSAAKVEFETLASDLINRCALIDRHMALIALERVHDDWMRTTCLQTAALADCKTFVGSAVCQEVLNQRWQRKIVSGWPVICLGILLAPLVPFIIQFDFGDSTNVAISRKLARLFDLYKSSSQVDDISVIAHKVNRKETDETAFSIRENLRKYTRFFRAPVTKFCFSTLTTCLFLTLYTYVLLFAYHDPSLGFNRSFEYLLHAWVFTLLSEALYEIYRFPVHSFKRKLIFWWKSVWNKADAFGLLLHITAFIIRLGAPPGNAELNFTAKVLFAFALFIFYVKLARVLDASTTLGPQLVMIGNMISELMPFLVIIFHVVVGFGVTHAAFYYFETLSLTWDNVKFVLNYSFWSFILGPDLTEIDIASLQEDANALTVREMPTCSDTSFSDCNFDVASSTVSTLVNLTAATVSSMLASSGDNGELNSLEWNETLAAPPGNGTPVMSIPHPAEGASKSTLSGSWLLSAFLAFWTLLAFLLANLLIAIFSNAYEEVSQNSNEIWKYTQYQMITEFESKQALPPPLSFLGLVYRMAKRFYRFVAAKCRKRRLINLKDKSSLARGAVPNDEFYISDPVNEDADHDPALNFEHETRSAMIRDRRRSERHDGVVNQLGDIHKQLATIRDQVSRLGRLETIAEAAVNEADNAEVKEELGEIDVTRASDEPKSSTPILSLKHVKPKARPVAAFRETNSSNLNTLEKRVDDLTMKVSQVQQLSVQLTAALKAQREARPPTATSQSTLLPPKQVSFEETSREVTEETTKPVVTNLPPTPPPRQIMYSQQPAVSLSPQYYMLPETFQNSRQMILPVAGIGLASVPRPVNIPRANPQRSSGNEAWADTTAANSFQNQVILDYRNSPRFTPSPRNPEN